MIKADAHIVAWFMSSNKFSRLQVRQGYNENERSHIDVAAKFWKPEILQSNIHLNIDFPMLIMMYEFMTCRNRKFDVQANKTRGAVR